MVMTEDFLNSIKRYGFLWKKTNFGIDNFFYNIYYKNICVFIRLDYHYTSEDKIIGLLKKNFYNKHGIFLDMFKEKKKFIKRRI